MSSPDSHAALIDRLYDALGRHDGEAMAACYRPDAVFEDPAFGRLTDGRPQAMWRMLTARAHDLEVVLVDRSASADEGRAHWQASYTFAATGRVVHNDVQARFVFRDGLIAEHRDAFDLRRWAAQALGPGGRLLGFTPALGPLIRRRTGAQLAAFSAGAGDWAAES